MVEIFTATLITSIVGLVLLLSIKHWELKTGSMVGRNVRPSINRFFHVVLLWSERIIPTLIRIYSRRALRSSLSFAHRGTARLVVKAEKGLEKTLHTLRHSTDVRRGMGEASFFLREVAEHKKQLLRTQNVPVRVRPE